VSRQFSAEYISEEKKIFLSVFFFQVSLIKKQLACVWGGGGGVVQGTEGLNLSRCINAYARAS
jgi:hypothetical protein